MTMMIMVTTWSDMHGVTSTNTNIGFPRRDLMLQCHIPDCLIPVVPYTGPRFHPFEDKKRANLSSFY